MSQQVNDQPRYEVIVGVAEAGREWFHETVVVQAPTRVIAAMRAEADIRRAREISEDAFVRTTVMGFAEPDPEPA